MNDEVGDDENVGGVIIKVSEISSVGSVGKRNWRGRSLRASVKSSAVVLECESDNEVSKESFILFPTQGERREKKKIQLAEECPVDLLAISIKFLI